MPQGRLFRAALALSVVASAMLAPAASAALDEVNTKKLRDAVTINGMLAHERALQRIANLNGGTRASGTPGYAASAAYVAERLRQAGYDVEEQEFTFPFFRDLADPTLTINGEEYETGTYTYSGSGDVTGTVVPALDNIVPMNPASPDSTSNAGCEASDFAPAPAEPAIALIQRGTCTFAVKTANAQAAGYDAVIIFNEGTAARMPLAPGTLGEPFDIPVVGLSYADGAEVNELAEAGTVTATVSTLTETNLEATTTNVIATSKKGNPDEQVIVGAHLDSVVEGPGINDNGSGTSQNLEIAEEIAELGIKPRRQLKFAFWGAEEANLLGSQYYVRPVDRRPVGEDLRQPQLRHDGVAQLRAVRVRR